MTKLALTKEEIATLKAARKILQKLKKHHLKLDSKCYEAGNDTEIVNFENRLYSEAYVDFNNDEPFISL